MSNGDCKMNRVVENVRGEQLIKMVQFNHLFNQSKPFSISIANGKGEIFFKQVDGDWYQSIMSVDRCFGVMKSKYSKVKI